MRDLECELRNFSQRDERNKKICIPLFMNIKMFFDILYSRYKDYFYSEICRNNCVLR